MEQRRNKMQDMLARISHLSLGGEFTNSLKSDSKLQLSFLSFLGFT